MIIYLKISAIIDNARMGLYLSTMGTMLQDSARQGKGEVTRKERQGLKEAWNNVLNPEGAAMAAPDADNWHTRLIPAKYIKQLKEECEEQALGALTEAYRSRIAVIDILCLQVDKNNYGPTGRAEYWSLYRLDNALDVMKITNYRIIGTLEEEQSRILNERKKEGTERSSGGNQEAIKENGKGNLYERCL